MTEQGRETIATEELDVAHLPTCRSQASIIGDINSIPWANSLCSMSSFPFWQVAIRVNAGLPLPLEPRSQD
jgi:hypothetical protein